MRKSKSTLVGMLIGFISISTVSQGAIITDDFNRADTAVASDNVASIIGNGWSNGSPTTATSNFRILNNEIDVTGSTTPWFLVNTAVGTINDGENNSFTLSGEIKLGVAGNNYAGLVVNYQDSQNYYEFRIKGTGDVQWFRIVNGSSGGTALNQAAAFTPVADLYYKMSVSSSTAYNYDLSIVDTTDDSVIFSKSITDTAQKFKDGLGGFYSSHNVSYFDNFNLETIPEPATAGLLITSAFGILCIRRRMMI